MAPPAPERRRRWLKPLTGLLGMVPAGVIAFRFFTGGLGANPIERALNQVGLWTLILLLTSLGCTPLKLLLGWNWPLKVRRMLGLLTFAYGFLHLAMYAVVDQGLAFGEIWGDVVKRKFITVGFAAFMLMVPLAITSSGKMVKKLGFPRWKRLHRLAYVVAVLGVIHFMWRVKSDLSEPLIYVGVLAVLFLIRVWGRWAGHRAV